jgi:tetratricopeptide (TPR) repeat protein
MLYWLLTCWFFAIPLMVSGASTSREDILQKALVNTKDAKDKVEIYTSLAKLVKKRSVDSALLYLDKAQVLLKQITCLDCMGKIFMLKGEITNMKGNPDEAIRHFKTAEFIFGTYGDKKSQAAALNWIGRIYQNSYAGSVHISESFRYYLRALGIAEEIRDTSLMARLYNNIAGVFINTLNYRSGVDYYKKAEKLWEIERDSINMAIANLNLGSAYVITDKLDSSRAFFEKAIPIFRARNNQLFMQICLVLLSYSSVKEERYTEAMDYLDQATTYVQTVGKKENYRLSKRVLSDINVLKGLIYYQQRSYSLAKKYLLQGYRLLNSLGEFERINNIYIPLCDIYEKTGKPDSASFFYRQVLIKSDSLLKNQISNFGKLAVVQIEFDRKIREKQMQLLYRQTVQKRNLMIFIGSGILLISFILILILRLRLEQQKKKRVESEKKQALLEKETANVKLESQRREMTMNVMNLIRKNELMLEFSNRLVNIGSNTTDERTGSEIMQLISAMEQNANNNVWEEFEVRFSQVHNNYYERLLSKFPDLSPADLKLCALLKLNLSTKEICELSGQRPATLDTARYRLRKKLGLTSQDNLITFLSRV